MDFKIENKNVRDLVNSITRGIFLLILFLIVGIIVILSVDESDTIEEQIEFLRILVSFNLFMLMSMFLPRMPKFFKGKKEEEDENDSGD